MTGNLNRALDFFSPSDLARSYSPHSPAALPRRTSEFWALQSCALPPEIATGVRKPSTVALGMTQSMTQLGADNAPFSAKIGEHSRPIYEPAKSSMM